MKKKKRKKGKNKGEVESVREGKRRSERGGGTWESWYSGRKLECRGR